MVFQTQKTDICFQVIQESVANLESTLKVEYEMHLEKVSSRKAYKNKIFKK
jgi:hypothetical protein